jgi:hypothetical protein
MKKAAEQSHEPNLAAAVGLRAAWPRPGGERNANARRCAAGSGAASTAARTPARQSVIATLIVTGCLGEDDRNAR